jgi:hypothetical protein
MVNTKHGRERYRRGCRCDECKAAQAAYQRVFRERQRNGLVGVANDAPDLDGTVRNLTVGPVEAAVREEIDGLASAALRPSLAAIAACMARLLDSPASTPKPAAAKVLISVLETLHRGSVQGRRGSLALVRTMTEKDGA